MKRFLLLALTAGLLSTSTVNADLGDAEEKIEKQSFLTFCLKQRNNCTVTFEGKRLRVNDSEGITAKQVLRYWKSEEVQEKNCFFCDVYDVLHISYLKANGSEANAKFIFGGYSKKHARYTEFENALIKFLGTNAKNICPKKEIQVTPNRG